MGCGYCSFGDQRRGPGNAGVVDAVAVDPGESRRAGPDRACGRGRKGNLGHGSAARGVAADRDQVARPVHRTRCGGPGRRAAAGAAEEGGRLGDHRRDPGAPAGAAGGDALVEPVTSQAARSRGCDRRACVAPVPRAAVAARDVQVLHRPAAGGQGQGCCRPVPEPAGEGDRAMRGREVPDPGAEPDRADPAAARGPAGEGDPRLPAQRHHDPCSPHWRSPPGR